MAVPGLLMLIFLGAIGINAMFYILESIKKGISSLDDAVHILYLIVVVIMVFLIFDKAL